MFLTRPPRDAPKDAPFDLHALGTPPALILSQDQTLHQYVQPTSSHRPHCVSFDDRVSPSSTRFHLHQPIPPPVTSTRHSRVQLPLPATSANAWFAAPSSARRSSKPLLPNRLRSARRQCASRSLFKVRRDRPSGPFRVAAVSSAHQLYRVFRFLTTLFRRAHLFPTLIGFFRTALAAH